MSSKRIIVVHPHGFCSGVARAVAAAEAALARYDGPIYGLHEIVHNAQVIRALTARGLRFVEQLAEIPSGAVVLFSAHGVPPAVRAEAYARQMQVIDATCPFVAKVHREVQRFVAEGCTVICIGHRAHAEVVGIVGEAPEHVCVVETEAEALAIHVTNPAKVALVAQTTLNPESTDSLRNILRSRFPQLRQPPHEDICYATRNRQQAVRILATQVERVLVLGSGNSSNSRRLVETVQLAGCQTDLIRDCTDLSAVPLTATNVLGIASGASTPESFLHEVLTALVAFGFSAPEELQAVPEPARIFRLPPPLDVP